MNWTGHVELIGTGQLHVRFWFGQLIERHPLWVALAFCHDRTPTRPIRCH